MPVGRISNIIDYAGNYYILKVEDKHGGSTKSLNEVRADIEKKLVPGRSPANSGALDRQAFGRKLTSRRSNAFSSSAYLHLLCWSNPVRAE
jgi:hypothetical protein